MKKEILFLSVLFLSGTISYGQLTATLAIPDLGGGIPAGNIFMPVTVEAIGGGDNFGTFQIFLVYDDPLVLTPVGVIYTNPNFPFYEWSNNLAYGPNEIVLTWLSFSGGYVPFPGEELCQIEWAYSGDPDYTNVWFNTVGDKIPGRPEKGMTAVWTTFGIQYTLTLNSGSTGPPPIAAYTWNGTVDNDWDYPFNWTPNGVPTPTDEVIIPAGTPNDPVIFGSAATFDLVVNAGAILTIDPLGDLTTYGLFTCDGDFEIITEGINGYSGSFIDLGGLAGTGIFYFTRNMFCTGAYIGYSEPPGWHYLSAPIDGFTSDDMYDYYINTWDETAGMWNHIEGDLLNCIPAQTTSLDVLEAWSINYALDYSCPLQGTGLDLEFSGPFIDMHTGSYSAPATFNSGTYIAWNFFGNPYPSGLNMNAIIWDPNAVPGAAYYDGCLGNYVYWTISFGSYSMSPGLGFFTEWAGPGRFALTGSERAHWADYFLKDKITNLITLEITGDEKRDITHIRFMEEAEAGFAKDGDFHKLFSVEVPQIYTTAGDDKLAINALPETDSVPMGMTSSVSGSFTISAIETSEFKNVVLEDLVTGIQTDLLAGSYTFEYTTGDDEGRFIVHFTPLEIGDNFTNSVNIWSSANYIYVQVPEITGEIVIFNMMGQKVVRTNLESGLNTIPMNDVNTYYVVKVLTSDNAVTGKVIIK
ncbi:MAG: T9SS type A sorting domain-containing protein [Bacteroidales bacterium]|nr:T9SS type A sorting domain-containing protein [Bacteroidales bacterium]